jgi:hypothetical protein
VILSAVVGVIVTGAAIFGAVYKQPSPLDYLPYVAVVIFVVGLLVPGDEASSGVPFEPDGAPVKL